MQKQFLHRLVPACALAIGLTLGMGNYLYAADEETTPTVTTTVSTTVATAVATDPGLVIVAVDEQGPAAAAGVARGDVLLTLNGVAVNSIGELEAALGEIEAGVAITVQVQHGDTVLDYTVETGDRNGRAYLGILPYIPARVFTMEAPRRARLLKRAGVAPLGDATATQVVVTAVLSDSVAATAGLQVDDVIIALDGETLARPRILRTYLAALEPGDEILLTVLRGAESLEIPITLAEGKNGRPDLGVRLGVILTTAAMPEETGFMQAMPAQPGFAAPDEFVAGDFGGGVQRFFRFFQAPMLSPDFAMPAPGMMAAPDVFVYGNSVLPGMAPSADVMMAPSSVREHHVERSIASEQAVPVEVQVEAVPAEDAAIPYY